MNFRRLIGSVAIAGVVGGSTLGIGAPVASASTDEASSGTAVVQQAGWHGYGYGPGRGHGYGHGFGHRGGWPIHDWGRPWGWHPWRW
jgi:hypothetical protein